MKKIAVFAPLLFLTSFFALLDCNKSDKNSNTFTQNNVNTNAIKIMPLGDSRVEGTTSNSVSYRYDLWKNLITNQWHIDFIGTQNDNTSYPMLLGNTFDPDHEGIGGFKTEDVLDNIDNFINDVGIPDVVLLGIGGNDLLRNIPVNEAINNINETIDILQNQNRNIIIFIEQIAPGRSDIMTTENTIIFNAFNSSIATLAKEQTNDTSQVIHVNMATNWSDSFFADNIHYNHLGAFEIAARYFEAIESYVTK